MSGSKCVTWFEVWSSSSKLWIHVWLISPLHQNKEWSNISILPFLTLRIFGLASCTSMLIQAYICQSGQQCTHLVTTNNGLICTIYSEYGVLLMILIHFRIIPPPKQKCGTNHTRGVSCVVKISLSQGVPHGNSFTRTLCQFTPVISISPLFFWSNDARA